MSWPVDLFNILRQYRRRFGRFPNLLSPTTFTEKMQVAKLTWRSPLLPRFIDKVEAKAFIAEQFGADLVTPSLYVGASLPPRAECNWPLPFVIKPSHWSGVNIFVRRPEDLDWDAIEPQLERLLGRKFGRSIGEWGYRPIRPRVLVEPFIGGEVPPVDFKLYTFGGRVAYFSLTAGRLDELSYAVYDREWRHLPLMLAIGQRMEPCSPPAELDRMIAIAEEIGKRLPFCRVDFYEVDGKARFGEITIYANSGLEPFDPPEYDRIFGDLFPAGKPADAW